MGILRSDAEDTLAKDIADCLEALRNSAEFNDVKNISSSVTTTDFKGSEESKLEGEDKSCKSHR